MRNRPGAPAAARLSAPHAPSATAPTATTPAHSLLPGLTKRPGGRAGEAAAGSRAAPPTPTPTPGDVYPPRPCRPVLEVPASATNRRPFRSGPAAGPPTPPSWPEEQPARSPGRPAVTDLRFRARRLPAGAPRAADRAGTSLATAPCPPRGPAPAGRTRGRSPGSGPRRALTSPRRRAWAAAALRLAVVEAGAGKEARGPRRRAAPRRDGGRRTAAAPPPPQPARWPFAGRGRLIPASGSGAPRSGAAALAGPADVACVSLPPPALRGRERLRVRTGERPRGAEP